MREIDQLHKFSAIMIFKSVCNSYGIDIIDIIEFAEKINICRIFRHPAIDV